MNNRMNVTLIERIMCTRRRKQRLNFTNIILWFHLDEKYFFVCNTVFGFYADYLFCTNTDGIRFQEYLHSSNTARFHQTNNHRNSYSVYFNTSVILCHKHIPLFSMLSDPTPWKNTHGRFFFLFTILFVILV